MRKTKKRNAKKTLDFKIECYTCPLHCKNKELFTQVAPLTLTALCTFNKAMKKQMQLLTDVENELDLNDIQQAQKAFKREIEIAKLYALNAVASEEWFYTSDILAELLTTLSGFVKIETWQDPQPILYDLPY